MSEPNAPYPPSSSTPNQSYSQPPYGTGPLPQQGYAPGYSAPPQVVVVNTGQATNGMATASLICSILGFIGLFGIGSLLGVIFGHLALNQIKKSNGAQGGHGLAVTGLVLGYIPLAGEVIALCFFILLAIGILGSAAGSHSALPLWFF